MTEQAFFHVEQPIYLWLLLLAPLLYGTARAVKRFSPGGIGGWAGHVDAHLIPFLTGGTAEDGTAEDGTAQRVTRVLPLLALCVTVIALAGPRYDFREADTPEPQQAAMLLLDISRSMNADDIKPSRMARARQEAEDMARALPASRNGLIAFAADAHLIVPLTKDTDALISRLPDMATDLPHIQGSALSPALAESVRAFGDASAAPSIILLSDGGFSDESGALMAAKNLAASGGHLHILGFGAEQPAMLRDERGRTLRNAYGGVVSAALEEGFLKQLADAGNGVYARANYGDNDTQAVVTAMAKNMQQASSAANGKTRIWEDYFYIPLAFAMLLLLPVFRRGALTACVMCCISLSSANAAEQTWLDRLGAFFMNDDQHAVNALEHQDYTAAEEAFSAPYNKGVAAYRAGRFHEAQRYFQDGTAPESAYNSGNALARQQKFEDALAAYKRVPETSAIYDDARHNMALVEQAMQQQQQQQQQEQGSSSEQQDGEESDEGDKSDQRQDSEQDGESGENQPSESSEQQQDASESEENGEPEDAEPTYQDKPEKDAGETEESDPVPEPSAEPENAEAEVKDTENAPPAPPKSPEDIRRDMDADLWLNRMDSDNKTFLKNRFYIESMKNNTRQGEQSW